MHRQLVFTLASILVVALAGCGASASASGGGYGGIGAAGTGGGGVGNAGGSGGGGLVLNDTCDAATKQLATTPGTPLGFSSSSTATWDSPSPAVIADLTPTDMSLAVGPNMVPVSFHFAGGDLTTAFAKGDAVVVHQDRGYDLQKLYGWSYVEGTRSAAVHNDNELTMYGTALAASPSPVGGPSISFASQCDYFEPMSQCQTSIDTTVLSVTATIGGDATTIYVGQTATVGGFQVYAGVSSKDTVIGSTSCTIETGFTHSLSVLTPPAP